MKAFKSLFWEVVWFAASFFGYVRIWEWSTSAGAWVNGTKEPFFRWPVTIRTKRIGYNRWRIILPEKRVPVAFFHNTGYFSVKLTNAFSSNRDRDLTYQEPVVKGDIIMFYFGGTAGVMVFTGWRWKSLVAPRIVTHFLIHGQCHEEGGMIQFRNRADIEWSVSTQSGISHKVMLDYLSGRISYGELLTTYQIGLLQQKQERDAWLEHALTYLERSKSAFKSQLVQDAVDCIKKARRFSQN